MFTIKFRDPQGTVYNNAVVTVKTINENTNTSSSNILDTSDLLNPTYNGTTSNNRNINYTAVYWPDQASYDSGLVPYILYNYNSMGIYGDPTFNVPMLSEYDGLPALDICELHLNSEVLDTNFPVA